MSWSLTYRSKEDFINNIPEFVSEQEVSQEIKEQIRAARDTAMYLVNSGTVGMGDVFVHLVGHVNPNHKPVDGWANDMIIVSVTQK